MHTSQALSRYTSVQVKTSSPGQILLMLWQGLFRFLGEAEQAMAAKDRARAGERIGRAHAILEHLAATLDPTHAPELCANLGGLYVFSMHRLVTANLKQDAAMIGEVRTVLEPLKEAWEIAVPEAEAQARR